MIPAAEAPDRGNVVCVDLDGTLITGDLLWESFVDLFKRRPLLGLRTLFALGRGRAAFKRAVADASEFDPAALPYRAELLTLLSDRRAAGDRLVLATASDQQLADRISEHLGIFHEAYGSNGTQNLSGQVKAERLVELFGRGGFEYIGNDWADIPIWVVSRRATAVSPPAALAVRLSALGVDVDVTGVARGRLRPIFRSLRSYQWVKNLLVFVPLLASHQWSNTKAWVASFLTFVAFNLSASAIYIVNDILDIRADRKHPRKRLRPIASGDMSIPTGVVAGAVLLSASFLIAMSASFRLTLVLSVYLLATVAYSASLKSRPVIDVFVLAALYVLRIVAGSAATGIDPSSWLLAFALFSFLSLAFVKRYTELLAVKDWIPGRGYGPVDSPWLQSVGTATGYMAVLVLALYVNSPEVNALYARPRLLWLLCPLLMYWFTRLWFRAGRSLVHDDPILETARDPFSYLLALAVVAIMLGAVR